MFSLNNGGIFGWLFNKASGVLSDASELKYYLFYFGFMLVMIAAAYLLGSLNSAIIVSRVLYRDDIRKHGSGNAGLTNTLRTYGKNAALLTLFGDILKTVLAVVVGGVLFGFGYIRAISTSEMCYVAGLFAVFGHVFPIYYKFKGGKGVLAASTMALILSPFLLLILFAIFAAIVAISKYVSLGSVIAVMTYPILLDRIEGTSICTVIAFLIAALVVYNHRENIKRLYEGKENRISIGKKDKERSDKE